MAPANKKATNGNLSIKEVASKLDLTEPTVKKYLKDFDLEVEKGKGIGLGYKAIISDDTFQALSEIAKLRANGLSIQEIKELKSQKPSKNILDEVEETQSSKKDVTDENKELLPLLDEANADKDGQELIDKPDIVTDEPEEGESVRKRRGFNYRYVERQISSDSKRVSSFRQRLRHPNLSVQDRLFFEEALERRILFLNGWKHILRWITK